MNAGFAIAVVIVAAACLAFELGMSSAIAEVIAGVLLGAILGEQMDIQSLHLLADLGMLGLMFMAGLEVDTGQLRRTWPSAVTIGLSALIVPGLGVAVAAWALLDLAALPAGLVGIALSTTSLAIVYHALKERGTLKAEMGQQLMAAASVVDVLSMVALAILLGDIGWSTAIFLLAFVPCAVGLPTLGQRIFRRYGEATTELELRFLLLVLLGLGIAAEISQGVHPAVVAFAAGLVMSDFLDDHGLVQTKLKGVVFSFFAPIFFLDSGLKFSLGAIGPEVLMDAALLFAVAASLKFFAAGVPARYLLGARMHVVGLLFNYRLSFGIIAASIGLEAGLIGEEAYAVLLLVVLASAALPALFLRDRPPPGTV